MPLLNEVIASCIKHYVEEGYDPAERRARYLRERQLMGRKPGLVKKNPTSSSKTFKKIDAKTPVKKPIPKKDPAQRRKEVEAKIEELKSRLARLRELLAELVQQAKVRSGVDEIETATKQPSGKAPSSSKLTEKQKADKAKAQQEYYEKNKDKLLDQQVTTLGAQIQSVAQKINDMRVKLATPTSRPAKKDRL